MNDSQRALLTYLGRELCRLMTPMFRAPPPTAMQRLLGRIAEPASCLRPAQNVRAIANSTKARDPRVDALLQFATRVAGFESDGHGARSRSARLD